MAQIEYYDPNKGQSKSLADTINSLLDKADHYDMYEYKLNELEKSFSDFKNTITKYLDYITDNINKVVSYSEYLAGELDKHLKNDEQISSPHKRIILVGAAASGKDYMRQLYENRGFKYAVSYTTRPPRKGEVDGKDYFFMSKEEFLEKVNEGFWYEYVDFNGWYYGTSKKQFYNDDVFIMTVSGISKLTKNDRLNSFIIFIDTPESVRRNRLLSRDMPGDTTERRIEADRKDLEGFKDYDIKITNEF